MITLRVFFLLSLLFTVITNFCNASFDEAIVAAQQHPLSQNVGQVHFETFGGFNKDIGTAFYVGKNHQGRGVVLTNAHVLDPVINEDGSHKWFVTALSFKLESPGGTIILNPAHKALYHKYFKCSKGLDDWSVDWGIMLIDAIPHLSPLEIVSYEQLNRLLDNLPYQDLDDGLPVLKDLNPPAEIIGHGFRRDGLWAVNDGTKKLVTRHLGVLGKVGYGNGKFYSQPLLATFKDHRTEDGEGSLRTKELIALNGFSGSPLLRDNKVIGVFSYLSLPTAWQNRLWFDWGFNKLTGLFNIPSPITGYGPRLRYSERNYFALFTEQNIAWIESSADTQLKRLEELEN